MVTATATKATRLLEITSGQGKPERVDAENGVIYGVKIVGLESRNLGRTIGLDAGEFGEALNKTYGYSRRALESAIPMYEGSAVRIDHPQSRLDGEGRRVVVERSRGALATAGELKNVRLKEDGLYADVHLLKSHPHTPFVLEVAERMPDKLAMSHNAYGVPVLQNGRAVIDQIVEVYSVDIVGDKPGTTNGLFETFEERKPMKKTIRQVVEALAPKFRGRKLLEEMLDDKDKLDGATIAEMEVEAVDSATPEEAVVDALHEVIAAVVRDDSLDTAGKLAKIKSILKIEDEVTGATSGEPTETTVETEESLQSKKGDDPRFKRVLETLSQTTRQLRELTAERDDLKATDHARSLLESMDREATDVRVKAVKALPDDAARKSLIETWAKQEPQFSAPSRPRVSAPLIESHAAEPLTGDKFIAAIRR